MKRTITLIIVAAIALMPLQAQKRKRTVAKKKPVVETPVEDPKISVMLASTQQIVFVDSMVVSKKDLLDAYQFNAETGTLYTFNEFFSTNAQPYSMVYVNQLGNKCWFSDNGRLYTSDWLNDRWSEPAPLEGLGNYQRINYPFVMADGTTIYFSAIGDDGIGGLDIYASRYDSETGKYLQAENIGMPFNSEGNDYMYAIDELDSIGYFATDRRQPEGMVCIYTFIPNRSRRSYSTDEYDEPTIRSRAAIERIADTWGDGAARKRALARIAALRKREQRMQPTLSDGVSFSFVVNDQATYTHLSDFKMPENRKLMTDLLTLRNRMLQLEAVLEQNREAFAVAGQQQRTNLRADIIAMEQEYYQLERDIHQLEKTIRTKELNSK